MNLLFDEESQKIIKNAKEEMLGLKHPYVGSEHLFLAVLKNNKLEITKILNKYDIFYDEFRNKLIEVIGIGKKENNWFLFTPLLKKILNIATYTAKDQGRCVTPYDLVSSIIQEGDGVANRILISMNIDLDALYDKLENKQHLILGEEDLLLDKYGYNMNEKCFSGKYDPVIGREDEVNQIIQILSRKNKNNPLLVGEAGVGKTAIVEELVRKITLGLVPDKLKTKKVYSLSMSILISGTKYRGEFEEKFHKIIDEVLNHQDIILFIDEIHTVIGAGGAEGAIDASNIVKPYLARGEFQVIGATTIQEYEKHLEKDKAFIRRFQKIIINEPHQEELKKIIMELLPIYEKFHLVSIPNEIIDKIITFSNFYLNGKQPDKMIDLLDEVCAYCESKTSDNEKISQKYLLKMKEISSKKNKAIMEHDFKLAMSLKENENKYTSKYNSLLYSSNKKERVVSIEDLYAVIYSKIKLPLNKILNKKIKQTRKIMTKEMVVFKNNIDNIFNVIDTNLNQQNQLPISVLLIMKNGVKETFCVDKLVENLFDRSIIKKISISSKTHSDFLFGNEKTLLLNSVKLNPFIVFMVEGIENNFSLNDSFYHIFNKGSIINKQGEILDFKNCIFFIKYHIDDTRIGFNNKIKSSVILDKYKEVVTKVIDMTDNSIKINNYVKS